MQPKARRRRPIVREPRSDRPLVSERLSDPILVRIAAKCYAHRGRAGLRLLPEERRSA